VIEDLGFCLLVKFESIMDALKVFAKEVDLSLPLNFQREPGSPNVIPSKSLLAYIDSFE